MRTFSLYLDDDRYSVPTLEFLTVRDEARAREIASRRLFESEHYRRASLVEGDDPVCVLTRESGTATA